MTDQAMTEADITRLATEYIGRIAWTTIWMTVGSIALFGAIFWASVQNFLPLWLVFIPAAYLVYVVYTPLHEAVHKNVCGNHPRLLWLNHLVGFVSATLLGVSYTMHRAAHIAHHRSTNVAGKDPDLVTTGGSLVEVLSCGSKMVVSEYADYFSSFFPRASTKEKAIVVIEIAVFVGWRVALVLAGYATEVFVLCVLANLVGVTLLGYIFAWIVHTPFNKTKRYQDTATILLPAWVHRPVTLLWLWQNFHSIHHLFPRVPFYQYERLFREIRPGMEERGSPILQLG